METKRYYLGVENCDSSRTGAWEEAIQEAVNLLKQGELVAFPTETVYGLGANALDPQACAKIFAVKGRPADNPLIVHVASMEEARRVARDWPREAEICAREFWPGPLTIILPKREDIPAIVSGGLDTVAIRLPSHPVALALLQKAGFPVAAPSANISGKPSPTEGKHVWQDLYGKIPLLIDAGKCPVGLESTVLDLTGVTPTILRPGGVTLEQLTEALGRVEVDRGVRGEKESSFKPRSPGMKYRHYAPQGEVMLIRGSAQEKREQVEQHLRNKTEGQKIALICLEETAADLEEETLDKVDLLFILGSVRQSRQAASRLFEGLRLCDEHKINLILAEEMPEKGIGLAFMNRLQKAAGQKNFLPPSQDKVF
ncbi:MAG TPA: threonylcarbamoyl-AMP synthase [Peptococcaceae bacterium]|nr:threonylcarbamoyl-AMP synthase [Peptococcaceae bacterium]